MADRDLDAQLMARAAVGDDAAIAELYRRHARAALRAARAVTGNRPDAEDAMSVAFIRILQALGSRRFAPDLRFRPYLLTASRHAAVDVIRQRTRCRPADHGELERPAEGGEPDERLMIEADRALIERLFRRLPERWQSVLLVLDVEGGTLRQAASQLGLSPNAAAQLAVRARAGLRTRYLLATGTAEDGPEQDRPVTEQPWGALGTVQSPRNL